MFRKRFTCFSGREYFASEVDRKWTQMECDQILSAYMDVTHSQLSFTNGSYCRYLGKHLGRYVCMNVSIYNRNATRVHNTKTTDPNIRTYLIFRTLFFNWQKIIY